MVPTLIPMALPTPYIIRIRPLRWRGVIYHDAMILPDLATGELWALDITQHSIRPRKMPLDTFLAMGDPILSIRELTSLNVADTWTTFAVLERTRRYHVVTYNCDHFMDELQFYRPHSEQLRQKLAITAVVVILLLLITFRLAN